MSIQSVGQGFVVVDLDTGTILGTNLVLVPAENMESVQEGSDNEIIEAAKKFSYPLYADICKFY